MEDDLIERLRNAAPWPRPQNGYCLTLEAATRIAELEAIIAQCIASMEDHNASALSSAISASMHGDEPHDCGLDFADTIALARAALENKP